MALSAARALLPLLAIALLPACSETPPREVTPWATAFPVQGSATINSLSVDGYSGSVALAGTFSGTVDFGTGPLESYFGSDIFVAELGDTGKASWGGHTGGSNYLGPQSVAVAPNGDVVATGMFTESIGFGAAPIKTLSQSSYLVRFDAAGNLLWQQRLGTDTNVVSSNAIAVDTEGNIVIAGSFSGPVNIGGVDLVSPGQSTFVAKYDASGNPIYGHGYSGSGHAALAVACDAFGDAVIYGRNSGDFYLGDQVFIATGSDAFVAKVDRQGADLWAIPLGSQQSYLAPTGLALGPGGEAVIAGAFFSSVTLGGLQISAQNQVSTAFAAQLSPSGKPTWLKAIGGNGPNGNNVNAVAVASTGDIYVTGAYSGNADLGTGPLPTVINTSLFLAELDTSGKARTVRTFDAESTTYTNGQALTIDPQGGLILAGALDGGLVFGGTTLHAPMNGYSLFAARLTTPL